MKGKARDRDMWGDGEKQNKNARDESRKRGREGFLTITNWGSIVLK